MFRSCTAVLTGSLNMAHDAVAQSELEKINKNISENEKENGDVKDVHYNRKTPFRRQALAALGTVMLNCGVGATAGFSAVLIPQLKHGHGKLGHKLNTEMESWVEPKFFSRR